MNVIEEVKNRLESNSNAFTDALSDETGRGTLKDHMDDLYDVLAEEIAKGRIPSELKQEYFERLNTFCHTKTNIMLVGATGSGKSSTINAIFSCEPEYRDEDLDDEMISRPSPIRRVEVAKVGTKSDPETKDIERYQIGNLVLWDTPGFGDGTEQDEHYKQLIWDLLSEKKDDGSWLIDLILVVLDGSSKDLNSTYTILNKVIFPVLDDDSKDMVVIALNQADIAMKTGRHWDYETNKPDSTLRMYLEEKCESIKNRIKENTGMVYEPIWYCAGYEEEGGDVVYPYNLSKLLYHMMLALPDEKKISCIEGVSECPEHYEFDDEDADYSWLIKNTFYEAFDYLNDEIDDSVEELSEVTGTLLGIPFMMAGAVLGGVVKGISLVMDDLFD